MSVRRPRRVSPMQHHARGYVDLRGSWYLYGQERLGRVYPDNEPGSPDHPESRINSGSHTGSRPDHAGTRTDHASHRTGSHRITSTRTHRITSGSRAGTRTDHVSNRRTGSTPDHVRRSRRNTHVRRSRRNTPDHVRETWSHSGSSHPLSELFELFPPRDQLALELIARRPADGA